LMPVLGEKVFVKEKVFTIMPGAHARHFAYRGMIWTSARPAAPRSCRRARLGFDLVLEQDQVFLKHGVF
jgi:hypothetical protein